MKERIDREQGLPLYRQVAEAIRYRVATGELKPGTRLPSLRRAAVVWGVNMHTIRRAYGELAAQGVLDLRAKASAVVRRPAAPAAAGRGAGAGATLDEFLAGVLRQGRLRWGLDATELAQRLSAAAESGAAAGPQVQVVECSETQARDLAAQLSGRFRVRATGWSLERDGEPPPGPVLATYFHYNDVRCRWPERLDEVRFAAIHPDAALRDRVASVWSAGGGAGPARVVLCEREPGMARNILADLVRILPASDFTVVAEVEAPEVLLRRAQGPVLFAPRVWGEMSDAQRAHPLALEVRYVFDERDVAALAAAAGWQPRGGGPLKGTGD
jgi:DNA-binding transcriptional regulator YhcF (GntR family)